jgi:MFS family permease
MATESDHRRVTPASAFRFVLILGIVSLFGDLTYEGASSINGPFLQKLGATAAAVGIIAGLGEFLGYALRLPASLVADKTGQYWIVTFIGYTINLLAVPALALAGNWQIAAVLMVTERIGRAIRKPSVDAMVSYAGSTLGRGWVFGLRNGLDQLGATVGPLVMALVLLNHPDNYHLCYALLLISAFLALVTLAIARLNFPDPSRLEAKPAARGKSFSSAYWLYMFGGACVAAGLVSFELISYHFSQKDVVEKAWIPVFFSVGMAVDAVAGLAFGKLFDRVGMATVFVAFGLSSLFAPLIFYGNVWMALAGMVLWGIGFGAQDTLLKALIAGLLPEKRRNLAFGLFYVGYGIGWLAGSVTTGVLYDHYRTAMVVFSVVMQLIAIPAFLIGSKTQQRAA